MISVNEFVLFYSELFKYLDKNFGKKEVKKLWKFIRNNYCKKLEALIREKDIKGMYEYWSNTSKEEGGKSALVLKDDEFILDWYKCPSMGKLINTHVKPYEEYCEHCEALYNPIIIKYGFEVNRYLINRKKGRCRLHVRKVKK